MARKLFEEAFELAKLEHGYTSNQARSAARELAHSLTLLEDHSRALVRVVDKRIALWGASSYVLLGSSVQHSLVTEACFGTTGPLIMNMVVLQRHRDSILGMLL